MEQTFIFSLVGSSIDDCGNGRSGMEVVKSQKTPGRTMNRSMIVQFARRSIDKSRNSPREIWCGFENVSIDLSTWSWMSFGQRSLTTYASELKWLSIDSSSARFGLIQIFVSVWKHFNRLNIWIWIDWHWNLRNDLIKWFSGLNRTDRAHLEISRDFENVSFDPSIQLNFGLTSHFQSEWWSDPVSNLHDLNLLYQSYLNRSISVCIIPQ